MSLWTLVKVCSIFYLVFPQKTACLWWAVGNPLVMDPNAICRKSRKLATKQQEICDKELEIVEHASSGAQLALKECKYQFQNRSWNCDTTTRPKAFGRTLQFDTRETAFVYAGTSAGVMFAITQACNTGELLQCSCDSSLKDVAVDGEWVWGGCSDNVVFGYRKSKDFMDARRKKRRKDFREMIRQHNNEAGRLAVRNYLRKECRCHGLSGSCTLKTCWRKMPFFRNIGDRLKKRFDGAIKVLGSNDGKTLVKEGLTIKDPEKEDLIYSEQSPNFCVVNKKVGSLGTRGRVCDPKSRGTGGCDLLCCGRKYKTRKVEVKENCQCRFLWCCKVVCKTCRYMKTVHRCE
uniref:Protein Wnt n=1 Tax=Terebratalia transversa TaxID=34513 RepID=A0AAU7EBH2_TERTR